ncbi:integrase [Paraburkholderia terricola]|uniref:site-specific integrase n=1 Tax=Paraburkholderia terricola TaxID=169427 RepID=UPI00286249AF|nr:site-specific integrase [Paraburkholderia terricola]MDR6450437.1 integrase [Paraburkholderia terricola]
MARLEFIFFEFYEPLHGAENALAWLKPKRPPLPSLPQLFWEDGRSWTEVNLWALEKAASYQVDTETVKRLMKHLTRFATFVESQEMDWRHFPVRKEDQILRRLRKSLIDDVNCGSLANSTASNCMNAVVQFYRFANANNLVGADHQMWTDRIVVIPYYDATGFRRSMVRISTDLKIPNRSRIGNNLEEGLLPLRADDMHALLKYTAAHEIAELHLMLGIGFFTGARIGTVTTLTVTSLFTAREDPLTPGIFLLPVGPGTGVATKFSVSGEILVPGAILADLKAYASCTRRLLREAKAGGHQKNLLFLTRNGRPYTVQTSNRLVYEMRRRAFRSGLRFMQRFRFHQTRATFGTWLMELLLDGGAKTDAIRVVRDAMLHKSEQTTLRYIAFLDNVRDKQRISAAFNAAFTGLQSRNWNFLRA